MNNNRSQTNVLLQRRNNQVLLVPSSKAEARRPQKKDTFHLDLTQTRGNDNHLLKKAFNTSIFMRNDAPEFGSNSKALQREELMIQNNINIINTETLYARIKDEKKKHIAARTEPNQAENSFTTFEQSNNPSSRVLSLITEHSDRKRSEAVCSSLSLPYCIRI